MAATKDSLKTLSTVRKAIWELQDSLAEHGEEFEFLRRRRHLFGLEDGDGDICWPNVDNRIQLVEGTGIDIDAQPDAHTITISSSAGSYDHNTLTGLQGGNGVDEYYHLTAAEYGALDNIDSLTGNRLVGTDGTGDLESVVDLTSYPCGLTQYQVLFGAADGSVIQSANLAFYTSRLYVDREIEIASSGSNPILRINFDAATDVGDPQVIFEENGTPIGGLGVDTGNSNALVLAHLTPTGGTTITGELDLTINATHGHVGIGIIADAAWDALSNVLQIGSQAAIFTIFGGNYACVGTNTYYDGTDWRYLTTDEASLYNQDSGKHQFYVTGSDAADNVIAWTTAMILDNSGNMRLNQYSAGPLHTDASGNVSALADPGADRIVFWDDSDGAVEYLTPSDHLSISTNNLNVDDIQVITVTSDTDLSAEYDGSSLAVLVLCDATAGDIVIELPSAASITGVKWTVKKIDSGANTVSVYAPGTEVIDGYD